MELQLDAPRNWREAVGNAEDVNRVLQQFGGIVELFQNPAFVRQPERQVSDGVIATQPGSGTIQKPVILG
jgi:hypothetical protein